MKYFKYIYCLFIVFHLTGCTFLKPDLNPVYPENISVSSPERDIDIKDLGDGWFEITEQVIIENITPETAKEIAISRAERHALESFGDVLIKSNILDIQAESQNKILLDNFVALSSQSYQGIILEKKVIKEELISDGNQMIKKVTVKIHIGKQKGVKDPLFSIKSELNKKYYKSGEELELSVVSSQDCYITVLNICSNDSVYVIFPNKFRDNNFLGAGEKFLLPSLEDKEMGLYFPVRLLSNKEEDTEIVKVIATKQKTMLSSILTFSAYGDYKTTLQNLQKCLLEIPRYEIEENDLIYYLYNGSQ